MIPKALLLVVAALLPFSSCTTREGLGPDYPGADRAAELGQLGKYSKDQIAALKSVLSKTTFPATEGTIAAMLPMSLLPLPIAHWDGAIPDSKGRIGGMVEEYWLNRDHVLRVAIAYYSEGEGCINREEWAVILTREERKKFSRPIY